VTTPRSEFTVQFLLELAGALNDAGEPVALNQARMERIAAAYDVADARVAVLPNLVLAAAGRGSPTALELRHPRLLVNRLDRTAAIDKLADDAERAAVDPEQGLRRLDEIASMRHRFGAAGVIGGHMVLTLGLALILQPTPQALGAATIFGALIGVLKIYARDMQTVGVLLPITAATLISALAFWFAPDQTIDGSMRILIPALVTFIPGSLLTTATLDLSAGEVISGSSRLVAGTMQLILLSFGIAVGALIAGVSLDQALTNEAANTLGDWAPWLGVIVFGIGAFVHFSGPPRSLGWFLIVLLAGAGRAGRASAQSSTPYPDWIPMSTKAPKRGGVMTRASAWDPPVLDPRLTQSVGLFQFAGLTSNRLVRYVFPDEASGTNDLTLKGDLAESWQASADSRVWTFKLRQGVKWQNVAPLNGRSPVIISYTTHARLY